MFFPLGNSVLHRKALLQRPLIGGALISLMLAALPQTARADCTGAAEDLAPVICSSASLTQAWDGIDTKLADISAAQPDLAFALAEDQALFTTLLGKTLQDLLDEHPTTEVPEILLTGLEDRLEFLQDIEFTTGPELTGAWQNAAGALLVTPQNAGEMKVQISVSEPIMGLNTCSLEAKGTEGAGLLTLALPSSDEITLSRAGQAALLAVDYTRAGRPAQGPTQCSNTPPVGGWYFRVKAWQ